MACKTKLLGCGPVTKQTQWSMGPVAYFHLKHPVYPFPLSLPTGSRLSDTKHQPHQVKSCSVACSIGHVLMGVVSLPAVQVNPHQVKRPSTSCKQYPLYPASSHPLPWYSHTCTPTEGMGWLLPFALTRLYLGWGASTNRWQHEHRSLQGVNDFD